MIFNLSLDELSVGRANGNNRETSPPLVLSLDTYDFAFRLERAIEFLSRMSKPNLRQMMKLNAALGVAILNTNGSISQMGEAFRKALEVRPSGRPAPTGSQR